MFRSLYIAVLIFAFSAGFLAAEGGAFSAIGSTGKVGEQYLQTLGGDPRVYFNTSLGGRYVDQLVGDVANESKVAYQSLTPSINLQISKDAELLNGGTVQGVNWHFFQSPVTGLGAPSQPLFNALQQNGWNIQAPGGGTQLFSSEPSAFTPNHEHIFYELALLSI